METKRDLTRELVNTLTKRETPTDYDTLLTTAIGYTPATGAWLSEVKPLPDLSAIQAILDTWAAGWTAALQREPAYGHLRTRFDTLVEAWRRETDFEVSATRRAIHWAYQQIIGMGPAALPFILAELRREEDDWFWALTAIVGDDVARGAETLTDATDRWLQWASEHPLVNSVLA